MYTEWTMKLKGDFRLKKLISILLAALVLASAAAVPAQAGYSLDTEYPVINICGNAQTIYDEDGVAVYDFDPDPEQIKV